ncbi:hypothetical protein [Amycolatopsis sp. cmx-4-61]|uniref:hypothetical protein n=1 Tax=Amycolatopsis sp. cmx-4-61 TaxID=2790937 RepID=UPI00397DCE59
MSASAFLVDADHIDALLTAGLAYARDLGALTWYYPTPDGPAPDDLSDLARQLTPSTAGRVGAMLLAENMRSVNHTRGSEGWEPPYLYRELPGDPDPVVVLKAISCLQAQSCEHPGWPDSEAYAFCDALHRMAVCRLPGWRQLTDTAWPIKNRRIFEQPEPA